LPPEIPHDIPMDFFLLIIVAIAVCSDSFAVAVTMGFTAGKVKRAQALGTAFIFATFQGTMPLIGWLIGSQSKELLAGFNWFGFILLTLVGSRMIYLGMKKEKVKTNFDPFRPLVLFTLAFASSIDALVVGLSFAFLELNILVTSTIIGSLTFVLAFTGVLFGRNIGSFFGKKVEIFGGALLIFIGIGFLLFNIFLN
jgi:manganese efflux pump family protein